MHPAEQTVRHHGESRGMSKRGIRNDSEFLSLVVASATIVPDNVREIVHERLVACEIPGTSQYDTKSFPRRFCVRTPMRLHILRRAERDERKFRGQEATQNRQANARHEISLSKQESVLPSRQRHVMNVFAPLRHALATAGTLHR